jgi:hypothetical protein
MPPATVIRRELRQENLQQQTVFHEKFSAPVAILSYMGGLPRLLADRPLANPKDAANAQAYEAHQIAAANEALAIARRDLNPNTYRVHIPDDINARQNLEPMTTTTCPICEADAEAFPLTGDFQGFNCSYHGKFEVSGTVMITRRQKGILEWERAFERAQDRASSGWPRIEDNDFL